MSNGDWIDRARSTRPEDYSSGDLGKLRDEARRSPEVRKALADEIRLDQALHASVGRSPLSTAKIVAAATAAAAAGTAAGGGIVGTIVSWLSVLIVTATVGLVAVLALPEPGSGPKPETVGTELPPARVERIDPIAEEDTSPSDRPPSFVTHPDIHPQPGFDKSSAAEKLPGAGKPPGVKPPHEPDYPAGVSRGVTQK
jgi:hypothetical protein